ncbi:hypothetical protein D3C84_605250 [compost metagenome]
MADAPEPGPGTDVSVRAAAARRAHQPPRPRRHPLARRVAQGLSGHLAADLPRPRLPRLGGGQRRSPGAAEADALPGRLLGLRAHPRRTPGATATGLREAAGPACAHGEVHRPLQGAGHQGPPGTEPDQGPGAPRRTGAGPCGLALRLQLPRGRQDIQPSAGPRRRPPRLRREDGARAGQAATGSGCAHRPARPQRRGQVDADQDPFRRPVASRWAPGARREPGHRLLRPASAGCPRSQGQPTAAPATHRSGGTRTDPARLPRWFRLPWRSLRRAGGQFLRGREGAPGPGADRLAEAQPAAAGRTHQPPRPGNAPGPDHGPAGFRRRRAGGVPRPPPAQEHHRRVPAGGRRPCAGLRWRPRRLRPLAGGFPCAPGACGEYAGEPGQDRQARPAPGGRRAASATGPAQA